MHRRNARVLRGFFGVAMVALGLIVTMAFLPHSKTSSSASSSLVLDGCEGDCLTAICDMVEHKFYEAPDQTGLDEQDGGFHSYCFDKTCCWNSDDGKHPRCGQACSDGFALQDAELERLFAVAAGNDAGALQWALILYRDRVVLNGDRCSLQQLGSCDDRVNMNIPLSAEIVAQLDDANEETWATELVSLWIDQRE